MKKKKKGIGRRESQDNTNKRENNIYSISINIYAILADSPGRALLLFMKQHGGYLSCPYCFIPGKIQIFY